MIQCDKIIRNIEIGNKVSKLVKIGITIVIISIPFLLFSSMFFMDMCGYIFIFDIFILIFTIIPFVIYELWN